MGEGGTRQHQQGGRAGRRGAHPSKALVNEEQGKQVRVLPVCPQIGPVFYWEDGGQASLVDGGPGHGAVVQGIAYAQVLFAPGTRSSHPWDLYAPTCVAVRAPQTGQVGMNSQTLPTGTSSGLRAWLVSHLHDFPLMTAGNVFEMAGGVGDGLWPLAEGLSPSVPPRLGRGIK